MVKHTYSFIRIPEFKSQQPHQVLQEDSTSHGSAGLYTYSTPHTDTHTTPHPAPPHTRTQVHTLLKTTAKVNKRESWKNYKQIREVSSTVVLAPQTPAQTQQRSFSTGESKAQCPNEKTHSLTLTRVARCYCGIFFFLLWNFLRFPLNGPITPQ